MSGYFYLDILVCLVTLDAESFGPEALSEVQILEKRIPTALPATPKPQPATTPGYYTISCGVKYFESIINYLELLVFYHIYTCMYSSSSCLLKRTPHIL